MQRIKILRNYKSQVFLYVVIDLNIFKVVRLSIQTSQYPTYRSPNWLMRLTEGFGEDSSCESATSNCITNFINLITQNSNLQSNDQSSNLESTNQTLDPQSLNGFDNQSNDLSNNDCNDQCNNETANCRPNIQLLKNYYLIAINDFNKIEGPFRSLLVPDRIPIIKMITQEQLDDYLQQKVNIQILISSDSVAEVLSIVSLKLTAEYEVDFPQN